MVTRLLPQFPNLQVGHARITSPKSDSYNCIAYAAGDTSKWWWPDAYGHSYWPPLAMRVEALPAFQQAYSLLGYQLCANGQHTDGIEKIAVFQSNGKPTHAARQLKNGVWTSKMGPWHDIVHTENCLTGSNEYGSIAFFMQRRFKSADS